MSSPPASRRDVSSLRPSTSLNQDDNRIQFGSVASTTSSQELIVIPTHQSSPNAPMAQTLPSASSSSASSTSGMSIALPAARDTFAGDGPPQDAVLSPTTTSSSRTPSSGFMDDETGLSDVSSLDNDDFELVERVHRPGLRTSVSVLGGSEHDDAQWDEPISRPASAYSASDSIMGSSSFLQPWTSDEGDASTTRQLPVLSPSASGAWSEIDALEGNLEDTHQLFREHKDQDASYEAGTPVGPSVVAAGAALPSSRSGFLRSSSNATMLVRAVERAATFSDAQQLKVAMTSSTELEHQLSVASSGTEHVGRFRFPDPTHLHQISQEPQSALTRDALSQDTASGPPIRALADKQSSASMPGGEPSRVLAARLTQSRIKAMTHHASVVNVFYLGRDAGANYTQLVSNTIKKSAMAAVAASDEGDFASFRAASSAHDLFRAAPSDDVGTSNVTVRFSSAELKSGRTLQVKEFFCTTSLSSEPGEDSRVQAWLQEDGASRLLDGGGLVVCFLESGECQQSLAVQLSVLLSKHQSRADLGKEPQSSTNLHPLPYLVPIIAPRLASNLEEADTPSASIVLSPQRDEHTAFAQACAGSDVAQDLARYLELRHISEEWAIVLQKTHQLLAESSREGGANAHGSELAVTICSQAMIEANEGWAGSVARQAATTLHPPHAASSQSWLTKASAWLNATPAFAVLPSGSERSTEPAERAARASDAWQQVAARASNAVQTLYSQAPAYADVKTRLQNVCPRIAWLRSARLPYVGAAVVVLASVILAMALSTQSGSPHNWLNPILAPSSLQPITNAVSSNDLPRQSPLPISRDDAAILGSATAPSTMWTPSFSSASAFTTSSGRLHGAKQFTKHLVSRQYGSGVQAVYSHEKCQSVMTSEPAYRRPGSRDLAVRANSSHKAVAIYKDLSTLLSLSRIDEGSIDDFKLSNADASRRRRRELFGASQGLSGSHALAAAGAGLAMSTTSDAARGAQILLSILQRSQAIVLSYLHRTWADWLVELAAFHSQFFRPAQDQIWREAVAVQADAATFWEGSIEALQGPLGAAQRHATNFAQFASDRMKESEEPLQNLKAQCGEWYKKAKPLLQEARVGSQVASEHIRRQLSQQARAAAKHARKGSKLASEHWTKHSKVASKHLREQARAAAEQAQKGSRIAAKHLAQQSMNTGQQLLKQFAKSEGATAHISSEAHEVLQEVFEDARIAAQGMQGRIDEQLARAKSEWKAIRAELKEARREAKSKAKDRKAGKKHERKKQQAKAKQEQGWRSKLPRSHSRWARHGD